VSATPAKVGDDCTMIRGVHSVDRLASQFNSLDNHLLIFTPGTEEDVVDPLINQLRAGLEWRRRMSGGKRHCVRSAVAGGPRVG
jgi:hypothetical protein